MSIVAGILMFYHGFFTVVIFQTFFIGIKLVKLSWDVETQISQTSHHKLEMLKAIGLLAVVFCISIWIAPQMRPIPEMEIVAIWLMGSLMGGYSLLAVMKYMGKSTKS